jgi:competence protein ComEA
MRPSAKRPAFPLPRRHRLLCSRICLLTAAMLPVGCGDTENGAAPLLSIAPPAVQPAPAPDPPQVLRPPVLAPPAPKVLVVAVDGAVERPGAYRMGEGDRVHDLIQLAGGTTPEADLSDINVAAYAQDATTLVIPTLPHPARPAYAAAQLNLPCYTRSGWRAPVAPSAVLPTSSAAPLETPAESVDLNTATQGQLETLPGVGEKTAQKIIAYRAQTPFNTVDDLANVPGIGEKRLEALRPMVQVR